MFEQPVGDAAPDVATRQMHVLPATHSADLRVDERHLQGREQTGAPGGVGVGEHDDLAGGRADPSAEGTALARVPPGSTFTVGRASRRRRASTRSSRSSTTRMISVGRSASQVRRQRSSTSASSRYTGTTSEVVVRKSLTTSL